MKKMCNIIFTFYFFLTSVGVAFGSHYCGKKVSHSIWNISVSASKRCCCDHNQKSEYNGKCCKDVTKWVKAKSDLSIMQASFQLNGSEITPIFKSYSVFTFSECYSKEHFVYSVSHSPPLSGISIYLKKRTLLI